MEPRRMAVLKHSLMWAISVADIKVNMVADIEVDMVADIEVDMVADIEVDMVADIDIDMEIQFGERFGHGGWLIGPKLFRPKAYASCASSKLCKFIV